MKEKLKFNLQHFAESAEPEDEENIEEPEDTPETEPEINPEDEKKYSDKEVDELINKKFAKWQKDQEKKITEAAKLAEMNAQEKAEYERDQLQKKLDELERANTLNQMGKTARTMLAEKGITIPEELVNVLLTDEADTTKANVDSFAEVFNKAVEDAVNEKLRAKTPERMAGGSTLTKAEILAVKDMEQRRKLIAENIKLFD